VTATKPPFIYAGGKSILAPRIAALLPAHGHYVEPFAGSLSVLFAKKPSAHETVSDIDSRLMRFWRVLRERPGDLARVCALTPHSLAEYTGNGFRDDGLDDLEAARRLWVQFTQSRTGTSRATGWRHFVHPSGGGCGMPAYLDGYVDRMAACAERLHNVSLECRPALDVIAWYGRSPDVCLYIDPPYLGSTRADAIYAHELRSDDEHRELAAALRGVKASVVLSGYPSSLYDLELFPDWHRVEFRAGTGQRAGTWANRTEVLWSNRPFPQATLFDTGEVSA
jgi:DNA adenine methylase